MLGTFLHTSEAASQVSVLSVDPARSSVVLKYIGPRGRWEDGRMGVEGTLLESDLVEHVDIQFATE